jgi:hypothetical protein
MLLIVIAAVAIILSILSHRYFAVSSDEIVDIASEEIRSNAKIQQANRLEYDDSFANVG